MDYILVFKKHTIMINNWRFWKQQKASVKWNNGTQSIKKRWSIGMSETHKAGKDFTLELFYGK